MGKIAAIARSPIGKNLTINDIARLASYFKEIELKAGEKLFKVGQKERQMFLICRGKLALKAKNKDGEEGTIYLGNGEIFGELSLLSESQRLVNASAETASSLLSLDDKSLAKIAKEAPSTKVKFFGAMFTVMAEKWQGIGKSLTELIS